MWIFSLILWLTTEIATSKISAFRQPSDYYCVTHENTKTRERGTCIKTARWKEKKSRGEEGFMGILHDKKPAKRKMASFGESENAGSCARRRNENWKAACKKCRLKARWSWGRSPQQRRKYKGGNTFSDLFERASIFREIALDSLLLMDHTFATFFFRFSFSAYPHWEIFAASLPKSDQHHCSRTTAQSSDATYTELEECWPRQHGGENKKEEVQGVVSGKLKFKKKRKKSCG